MKWWSLKFRIGYQQDVSGLRSLVHTSKRHVNWICRHTHTHTHTHTLTYKQHLFALSHRLNESTWQQRCRFASVFSFYMLSRYDAGTVYFRTWEGSREALRRTHYWERNDSRKGRLRYEWRRAREREREGSWAACVEITEDSTQFHPPHWIR
jgi:hypothetical protein